MAIPYGTPGFMMCKDDHGKIFGLRDYWYTQEDHRDYLTITVKNDARSGWTTFSIDEWSGYGPKHMAHAANEKAGEFNKRDGCVLSIPCDAREKKPGCFGAYGLPSCKTPGCSWFARCKQSQTDY